jgi:16S rRNA (uracil1498-N3)-methyltransferase
LTRVYVREPLAATGEIVLDGGASEHVVRVLRLRAGAALTLFDGHGGEYDARVAAIGRGRVRVQVGAHRGDERESPIPVTLIQALARGERMDLIVQKATELGVSRIVPLEAERSVVQLAAHARARKVEHWRSVAASACEQCGRNRLPELAEPCTLEAALALAAPAMTRLLLDPQAETSLATRLERAGSGGIALLVGPEGGLTDLEAKHAALGGFLPCRLGPRVLRTETAAIAALAAIQTLAGDLGAR